MKRLNKEDRLRLMRFVCSFAWADLEVREAERDYIHGLVARLKLPEDEAKQVEAWLKMPPKPEEVDPAKVPLEHRQLFLNTVKELLEADGAVSKEERENLRLLKALLR